MGSRHTWTRLLGVGFLGALTTLLHAAGAMMNWNLLIRAVLVSAPVIPLVLLAGQANVPKRLRNAAWGSFGVGWGVAYAIWSWAALHSDPTLFVTVTLVIGAAAYSLVSARMPVGGP